MYTNGDSCLRATEHDGAEGGFLEASVTRYTELWRMSPRCWRTCWLGFVEARGDSREKTQSTEIWESSEELAQSLVWLRLKKEALEDVCMQSLSHVQLYATLWTVAYQASLSMEFYKQEYWSDLPFPPPGDLPFPELEPASLMSPALAGRFFTTSTTWEAPER